MEVRPFQSRGGEQGFVLTKGQRGVRVSVDLDGEPLALIHSISEMAKYLPYRIFFFFILADISLCVFFIIGTQTVF